MHFIILDIDWIWNNFCQNTHLVQPLCCTDKQVIDLRNLKVSLWEQSRSSRSSNGWLFSNTEIYKPLKPFWLSLELSPRHMSASTFRLFLYLACFADSETPCVCPTRPSYDRALQQELGHWLCGSQNLQLSPDNLIARWPAGARTWTQSWTMSPVLIN